MTAMERTLTTLGHREPDRVPLFLLFTLHGAREVGLAPRDYFAAPESVADGQIRLQRKFGHDCLYAFHYAAVETEARGGEVIFPPDGPPNAGAPIARRAEIGRLGEVEIAKAPALKRVLDTIAHMRRRTAGDIPIIGVVMSPFSVPVMQLGFEDYLDLLLHDAEGFRRLCAVNESFCADWANAQLDAGATAICYFDPVSSPTIVMPDLYRRTGREIAKRTLARIKGPTATHMASGRLLPIVDDLAATGTAAVGAGSLEELAAVKAACRGKVSILGNLNGVEMRRWTADEAVAATRAAIAAGAPDGGFILSDQHGELHPSIPDAVLHAVAETVRREGNYPIRGADGGR